MNNPLYNQQNPQAQNLIGQFQRFRQSFSGDPKEQIQQLLNSGRITQEQYNKAVSIANQLRQIMGI